MFKHRYTKLALIGLVTVTLAGCATHDRRHNNTMVGAGLGAAAGAVVSQGNPWYTLGGAAAGGVLGNILTEDDRRSRHRAHGNKHRHKHEKGGRHHHRR